MENKVIKVLLVEDNQIDAQITKEILAASLTIHFEVLHVISLEKALKALKKEKYEVILLDYLLPDSMGIDTIVAIQEKVPTIPILVLTWTEDEKIIDQVINKGAQDLLIKGEMLAGSLIRSISYAIERQQMLESLKQLDRLKSEFVSSVSHELRTPLTTIREGVSLVLDEVLGKINNEQREFLNIALSDIDRLGRIINDLLDIAKLEAGKVELKREFFDIRNVIKKVKASFAPKMEDKGLEFRLKIGTEPMEVYADKDRICQVLVNLVGNAIKFTQKGYIEIGVENAGNMLQCWVLDTGDGIKEKDLNTIFARFHQVGKISGVGGAGTGLGLAITKEIMEMHKGSIAVESIWKKGSNFVFSLPLYTEEQIVEEIVEKEIEKMKKEGLSFFIFDCQLHNFEEVLEKRGKSMALRLMEKFFNEVETLMPHGRCFPLLKSKRIVVAKEIDPVLGINSEVVLLKKKMKSALLKIKEERCFDFSFGHVVYPVDGIKTEVLLKKIEENKISESEERLNKCIMIVDDEPLIRGILRDILERIGYNDILEAGNGCEVLDIMEERIPDLLILDISMPKMNGYEVIGRLKESEKMKNIPIIIVSQQIKEDKLEEYLQKDIVVVNKPFIPEDIEKFVFLIL